MMGQKWEKVNLVDDVNECTSVNWDIDIINYLDTNTSSCSSDVLGPEGLPLTASAESKIRRLAISSLLWQAWNFLVNYAEDDVEGWEESRKVLGRKLLGSKGVLERLDFVPGR